MTMLWVVLAGLTALGLGRSVLIWSFLAYGFGPWAMLFVLLGPKTHVIERRIAYLKKIDAELKSLDKPEGYKEFNNVDDLFKQLENK
jgi:hypothetical protein